MAIATCSGHVVVVDEDRTLTPLIDRQPDAPARERVDHGDGSKSAPTRREAGNAAPFSSVLCGIDNTANGRAARDQAVLLASPGARIELVPFPQLMRHGDRALHDACEGHDLLALGAGTGAFRAVDQLPIPVLIARWCPLPTDVTRTILVPVDDSPESSRAVVLAGRLAAASGGTVAILAAPARDPALERAIVASRRILLQTTGAVPRLLGDPLPPEEAIRAAAVALTASLVVLGTGRSERARRITAQIAGRVGSSVLAVPG
jgi:nucleotide-binding universal stress UspA family protein